MTDRSAPRALTENELTEVLASSRFGTLATIRRSGHPHLATMLYAWDPGTRTLRFTTRAGRPKLAHLARDPRASLHVQGPDVRSYAVAEGEASVSAPSREAGDEIGRELRAIAGELVADGDEEVFLREQVAEGRVVVRLRVHRLYGAQLP